LKLNYRSYYINFTLILYILIYCNACEDNTDDNIFKTDSTIWVNAIIGTEDSVKIYLGSTSGMNSGDLAQFRDDATVHLFINNSSSPNLLRYNVDSDLKGYYYYPRLANVRPGDSLSFKARIEGSEFKEIAGKTRFPFPVLISSLKVNSVANLFNNKRKIDLTVFLDSASFDNNKKYFELKIQNQMFTEKDDFPGTPSQVETINVLNNINIPYGMVWNERLNSIFIDYEQVMGKDIGVSFEITDNSFKNNIEIELRTISKEYYEYCKAIDSGFSGISNIKNGSGIFTGFSRSSKTITLK
jgi:hypothetical protein